MRRRLTGARLRPDVVAFVAVVVVLSALTGVAIARAVGDQHRRSQPTPATARDTVLDLGAVLDAPHLVFRSSAPGPTYGRLAVVPLADPGGVRSVSSLSCDRVFATPGAGICLIAERGAVTRYEGRLLSGRLTPVRDLAVDGAPSRARLSADGTLAATTVFLVGHAYGTAGFVTGTTIVEVATGRSLGNLEKDFTTRIDGRVVTAADLNVWGVTFAPGPAPTTFYATVSTGGTTWLVRGDLTARTLTSVRPDAECPSLSPDGTHLVYKKRAGSPITWRYHVMDVATGREWPLAESRSVDDQAAWWDDDTVIYGLARPGTAETDVWTVPIRGGTPRVLVPDAWSPAVVRAPATGR